MPLRALQKCVDPACERPGCRTRRRDAEGKPCCTAQRQGKILTGCALKAVAKKEAVEKAVRSRNELTTLTRLGLGLRVSVKIKAGDATLMASKAKKAKSPNEAKSSNEAPQTPLRKPLRELTSLMPLRGRANSSELPSTEDVVLGHSGGGPRASGCGSTQADLINKIKGFRLMLEGIYGEPEAYAILARALRLASSDVAARALARHSELALAGAAISISVAMEVGALEWDGLYRTMTWGSDKPIPYFVTEGALDFQMNSTASTKSIATCRCDASSKAQCRCVWLALAPRGQVLAAEWALLGVRTYSM